ncbi:sigma 54-interacting transcriptional regulator [bacterium]|nr:sigma 54-interacting transcriptional regulator [bacterium]
MQLSYTLSPIDFQLLDKAAKLILSKENLSFYQIEANNYKKLSDKINYYKNVVKLGKISFGITTDLNQKIEILQNIGKIYDKTGIGDYAKVYQFILTLCEPQKNFSGMIETYRYFAEALQRRGNFGEALAQINKAIELNLILCDEEQSIKNTLLLSIIFRKMRKPEDSRKCLDFVLMKTQKPEFLVDAYNFSGILELQVKNFDSAITYFKKSYNSATEIQDKIRLADAVLNIGIVYGEFGNHSEAIDIFQEYANHCFENGDLIGIGRAYINLGVTEMHLKNYEEMVKCFIKAIRAYQTFGGNLQEKTLAFNGLGSAFVSLGEFEKARKYYLKGLEIASELQDEKWVEIINSKLLELKEKPESLGKTQKQDLTNKTLIYQLQPQTQKIIEIQDVFYSFEEIEKMLLHGHWTKVKELLDAGKLDFLAPKDFFKIDTAIKIFEASQKSIQNSHYGMIGTSAKLKKVIEQIELYSDSHLNIIIEGETGTGKELIARAIHKASERKNAPFVAVDCGAFTETLLESELFGHKKGSFTGAISDKAGIFEEAEKGTLFLDEIGTMSLAFQSKFLRVLQEGEIRRVGENFNRKIDIRIVVASNISLLKKINNGSFRKDLYFRLNGETIFTPPLRERLEDIPLLFAYFFNKLNENYKTNFFPDYKLINEILEQPNWDGNIRQLEHEISKSFVKSKNVYKLTEIKELNSNEDKTKLQQDVIKDTINKFGGNITKAANYLEISRKTLYKRLKNTD